MTCRCGAPLVVTIRCEAFVLRECTLNAHSYREELVVVHEPGRFVDTPRRRPPESGPPCARCGDPIEPGRPTASFCQPCGPRARSQRAAMTLRIARAAKAETPRPRRRRAMLITPERCGWCAKGRRGLLALPCHRHGGPTHTERMKLYARAVRGRLVEA